MSDHEKHPELPEEVAAIREAIHRFFETPCAEAAKIGNVKHGVYAFFDYDVEPIYVGQTYESIRQRVGRHLTNQRTDAVAMNVLDPFEVAEVEVWPLDAEVSGFRDLNAKKEFLNRAEYTVFQRVLQNSTLGAVLNEKELVAKEMIELPRSFRQRVVPDDIYERRKHPDIRIARRANTIANLARVISERSVSKGLRLTLLTQARRLELLASRRVGEIGAEDSEPQKSPGEEE